LFIYYTSVLAGTEARTYVINKQGCGLARKGHGNVVIVKKKSSIMHCYKENKLPKVFNTF